MAWHLFGAKPLFKLMMGNMFIWLSKKCWPIWKSFRCANGFSRLLHILVTKNPQKCWQDSFRNNIIHMCFSCCPLHNLRYTISCPFTPHHYSNPLPGYRRDQHKMSWPIAWWRYRLCFPIFSLWHFPSNLYIRYRNFSTNSTSSWKMLGSSTCVLMY